MKQIWRFFGDSCGILCHQQSVRAMVFKWWLVKPKNKIHELLLQCTPIICWEIWKSRCGKRFEDIPISIDRIINQVSWLTRLILNSHFPSLKANNNWHDMCDKVESAKQYLDIKM